MTHGKHLWAVVIIVSLVVTGGLIGCSLLDQGEDTPTAPAAGSADDLSNLYVCRGSSEGYGVFIKAGLLVVNLPAAGDYVIPYTTAQGTFYVAVRIDNPAQVFIGLQPGDTIINAGIATTTITASASTGQQIGDMLVFSWPKKPHPQGLDQITTLPTGTTATILLNNPPTGVTVILIVKDGELQTSGTDVFELPEPEIASGAAVAF